jgi:hypothetical protein
MDPRVELILDELSTLPQGKAVDFNYWKSRFQTVFSENLDPNSRETLLQSYASFLDFFDRGLVAQDRDPKPFREARKLDWNTLCIQEALQRSGTDIFYPDDLHEIVSREIAAGRMDESEFSQLAADGARVLGRGGNEASTPKKGFFSRFFG